MLNIGHIAKTYGLLPSVVVANATTYDLMIADVMSSWEEYQYNKASGKSSTPQLTTEEMVKMMEAARGNK